MHNGGPAFPKSGFYTEESDSKFDNEPESGMSLRDYFAGQALSGMCSIEDGNRMSCREEAAKTAFELADAMLTERQKGEAND